MSTLISASTSPIDIKSVLSEFDSSGQSVAAFARSRGIAPWKLHYALARRAGKRRPLSQPRSAKPDFIPVRVIESKPTSTAAPLELLLAGGHRLRISSNFDPEHLRRVVEALSRC
jgi:hypothetical protein